MKLALPAVALILLAACGGKGATDAGPTRYNFGIVDGANQVSTAGDAALAKRITSQLTRDPQGTFATRVFDLLAPAVAYAQGLTLSGTPVAGAIVCGREAKLGEPQIVPLCAFTLSDGKAANAVQPGTKAGRFNILFTAQVPALAPVADSTTVTVVAGPVCSGSSGQYVNACTIFTHYTCVTPVNDNITGYGCIVSVGDTVIFTADRAFDKFGNLVPNWDATGVKAFAALTGSEPGQPAPINPGWAIIIKPEWRAVADGTTCERLPCQRYVYVFLDQMRVGQATLFVQ